MYKKLFIATALAIGLFNQPAWCMEEKEQFPTYETKETEVRVRKAKITISGISCAYAVILSDYITNEIKEIQFFGPSGPCGIKGTTFDGIEYAADDLVIDLEWASDIDWDNLTKAMKKYKTKHGHSPKVIYVKNIIYRLIWDNPTSVYTV